MKVPRLKTITRALVASVALVSLGPSVGAIDPPVIDQTGYWSETGGTVAPGVTPANPAPPTVPAGSIAVSAVAGRTYAVAAVGLTLGLASGSTVSNLTLALKPAGSGSDSSTPATAIEACAITVFWAGADNGPLAQAPTHDCGKGRAPGVRAADGTWTFDLTSMGAQWADESSGLSPNGVLLIPSADPPGQTFSVAFARSTITASVTASEPTPDSGSETFTDTAVSEVSSSPVDPGPTSDLPEITDPGPTPDVPADVSPPASTPPAPVAEPAAEVAAPASVRPISGGPGTLGGWPLGTFISFVIAVLIALLASLTLGLRPEQVVAHREGGLSRALAARSKNEVL